MQIECPMHLSESYYILAFIGLATLEYCLKSCYKSDIPTPSPYYSRNVNPKIESFQLSALFIAASKGIRALKESRLGAFYRYATPE